MIKYRHNLLHVMRLEPFYLAHKLDDVKLLAYTIKELEELLP